jgi:hypothetical protein
MPIRKPCSDRSLMAWFSLIGGGGNGFQNGASEMIADQPITKAKTRKFADAFSGDPVVSPAVRS